MKRILLATIVLLAIGVMAYAQQSQQGTSGNPPSNQTKQNAKQYLDQAKKRNSEFQDTLAELKELNGSNRDAYTFNRLKKEIEYIESTINAEDKSIRASLDKGTKVNSEVINRIESFINQHTAKMEELEDFVNN